MSIFISFEGTDGSGKSTQSKLLADYLRRKGYDILLTREPGGTKIGEQIRQLLLDTNNSEISYETEILLYSASRSQLVKQVILPHLKQGGVVLCDRYADSFYAYQGYGRHNDFESLRMITGFASQGLKPDLTIYLDIDVEQGLKRKMAANVDDKAQEWNRLDQLELSFHQRVHNGYREMARAEPDRWLVVDASASIEEIHSEICYRLKGVLE